jgi:hypothetical protein
MNAGGRATHGAVAGGEGIKVNALATDFHHETTGTEKNLCHGHIAT